MFFAKLKTQILRDGQIARLRDALWRRLIELLLIAVDENSGGELPQLEDMAWILHMEPEILEAEMNELADVGFLTRQNGLWIFADLDAWQLSQTTGARRLREWRRRKVELDLAPAAVKGRSRNSETKQNSGSRARERKSNSSPPYNQQWWVTFCEDNGIPLWDNDQDYQLLVSPASVCWLSATQRWPGYSNLELIRRELGEKPNEERLHQVYQRWIGSGFRKENVVGILEWYNQPTNERVPAKSRTTENDVLKLFAEAEVE